MKNAAVALRPSASGHWIPAGGSAVPSSWHSLHRAVRARFFLPAVAFGQLITQFLQTSLEIRFELSAHGLMLLTFLFDLFTEFQEGRTSTFQFGLQC
jgi:hypothetical protein